MKLVIIAPCYNEEEVLPETTSRLTDVLQRLTRSGQITEGRILYVDDGSKDRTWTLIKDFATHDPAICGLKLSRNEGHQQALWAGLQWASVHADAAISIDADLQDDVEAILPMVEYFRKGIDVVYGVRRQRATDTFFKRHTALLFYRLMKALGAANFAASYSGLLAYFFLGAALIAVCMYLSTLTENQIVAALSGFGVLLVCYLMPAIQTLFTAGSSLALVVFAIILGAASLIIGLRSRSLVLGGGVFAVGCIALAVLFSVRSAALTTAFSEVLGALALFEPFLNFVNGLFDVTALVYYAGVAGLFLFLTGQALEKRRWN